MLAWSSPDHCNKWHRGSGGSSDLTGQQLHQAVHHGDERRGCHRPDVVVEILQAFCDGREHPRQQRGDQVLGQTGRPATIRQNISRRRSRSREYLSDSQGVLDPQQATVPGLPLIFFQQFQQNIYRHGDTGFIHVTESHAESLSTSLPDRSHHLATDWRFWTLGRVDGILNPSDPLAQHC